jgi:hypothetical protein
MHGIVEGTPSPALHGTLEGTRWNRRNCWEMWPKPTWANEPSIRGGSRYYSSEVEAEIARSPAWFPGAFAISGRSAAWLARLLGVQEVVGSNPAGPTRRLTPHTPAAHPAGVCHFAVQSRPRQFRLFGAGVEVRKVDVVASDNVANWDVVVSLTALSVASDNLIRLVLFPIRRFFGQ